MPVPNPFESDDIANYDSDVLRCKEIITYINCMSCPAGNTGTHTRQKAVRSTIRHRKLIRGSAGAYIFGLNGYYVGKPISRNCSIRGNGGIIVNIKRASGQQPPIDRNVDVFGRIIRIRYVDGEGDFVIRITIAHAYR